MNYDELDLLELFYSEGESLTGNNGDGTFLYKRESGEFSLTVFLYSYEEQINIYLKYQDNDLCSTILKGITALVRTDSYLKIMKKDNEVGRIYFGEYFKIRINVDRCQ
ncbi:hypothetical protein [Listeria valentina]|uniref:hypothetical protein n=1 Tax=Listeria valentina TaxID=2705293 RepID=UPI00142FA4C9|nr:hypothetical protein [Listeria valentina]